MKRSSAYWVWLLADVSLDRAAPVLPLVGFPAIQHDIVKRSIDSTGERLKPDTTELRALGQIVSDELRRELGDAGKSVENWLRSFCFTDEASRPDLFYWDSHFQDLLSVDPILAPEELNPQLWEALMGAYHGTKPNAGYFLAKAFSRAANVIVAKQTIISAIKKARESPLTEHDLSIYMRFGWNDDGVNQGLASLEIGARLSAVKFFWQAIEQHVPAAALESIAHKRDIAMWEITAKPEQFSPDAQRYGVAPEQIAANIFPRPESPPKLSCLLES